MDSRTIAVRTSINPQFRECPRIYGVVQWTSIIIETFVLNIFHPFVICLFWHSFIKRLFVLAVNVIELQLLSAFIVIYSNCSMMLQNSTQIMNFCKLWQVFLVSCTASTCKLRWLLFFLLSSIQRSTHGCRCIQYRVPLNCFHIFINALNRFLMFSYDEVYSWCFKYYHSRW